MPIFDLEVRDVRFTEANDDLKRTGLLGWTSFVVNNAIILDGVAIRRTRDGRVTLSFPARRDKYGVDHPYIRPLDHHARVVIEARVLAALPGAIDRNRANA